MRRGEIKNVVVPTGIGVPLGQILVWVLETFYLSEPIPSEVAIAFGTVLTGLLGALMLLAFYLKRKPKHDDETDNAGA